MGGIHCAERDAEKLRRRRKETTMFDKKYVRVESIALGRAYKLRDEAERPHLYLASSRLSREGGFAALMAEHREYVYGRAGDFPRCDTATLEELGLADELEAMPTNTPSDVAMPLIFFQRAYEFSFNDPKTHELALLVAIRYGKKTQESDWALLGESATGVGEKGFMSCETQLIYRQYDSAG